jgi:acetyl esterase/lipase
VAFVHGGFWRARYDLLHAGHLCAALAEAGVATWNIEYRRIGHEGGGWPGTFQDVAAAVRYLVQNADALGIDATRVVVMGHSAGGHLAAWLASLANVPESSPVASDPVAIRAAVSLAGVVDLQRAWELQLSGGVVGELLGGPPDEHPERYAAASPITLLPPPVPVVLIHGAADDIVPFKISERYRDAAVAVCGDASLVALPGVDHFAVIDPTSAVWPCIGSVLRCLLA